MKDFDLRKYMSENPLLEDTSTSEDFFDSLIEIIIENYCEENNILRENLNENFLKKLKSGIKDLSSKAKNRAKSAIDKIKSVTSDPKQALKDLSKIQKLYSNSSTEKFIKDLQLALSLSNKSNLNEAFKGTFTDIEQITRLEDGDKFRWKGEKQSSPYVNVKIENHKDDEQGVLIPGSGYTKIGKLDIEGAGKDRTVDYLVSTKKLLEYEDEFEEDEKRKTLLGFFGKYPRIKNTIAALMMTLGLFSVGSGITGDTPIETSATFPNNFIELVQDGDIDSILPDPDTTITLGGPFPTDGENSTNDSVVDKVSNSLDKANVDLGDTNLDNTDDNNAAVQTHDVGEYEISDAEKEAIVKNLVEETLEDLNNQIDKLKGKVINSINLDIDFGGVVSNQGDADSNKADDGTDLIKGRSDTAEDIAKKAGEQLTKIIKNTLGDNVKVDINYDLVDTHDSYKNQVEEEARDEMGTQSSFETITVKGIDAVEGETNETPPDLMYNYLYDPQIPPAKIPTKSTPPPPPPPTQEKGVNIAKTDKFDNMNRHNQIAVILGQISPSLDIYDKLESEGIKSELTGQLDDILKNEKASNELKKLAKLIVTIRKSPNAFLKKVAKATGVEFSIRAKAKMTGYGKKGQSAAKLGLTETVLQSLKEGIIDDMIKDTDILAKKIDVIALLGSMYKSNSQKDGKRLSVLDQSKLSDEDKSKLKGIGFSTKEKSGKYMFMDDDEYKEFVKNKETGEEGSKGSEEHKNEPRLKAIEKELERKKDIQLALKLVDQTQEIDPFILGLLSLLPDKFENSKVNLKIIVQKAIERLDQLNKPNKKEVKEEIKKQNSQVKNALEKIANNKVIMSRLQTVKQIPEAVKLLTDVFFDNDDEQLIPFPGASYSEVKQGFLRVKRLLDSDKELKKGFDTKSKEDDEKGLDVFYQRYTSSTTAGDQKINYTLTKEQLQSLIKNIITEGLTPSQASKVKDKYKQIYSGMLKGDKKKLLKYIDDKFGRPNPDAMAMGRAVNLSKKEEDENVEEAKTEKQRKYMCVMAQQGAKRPKGLSKAQAKEMCADTSLSKSKQEEQKLSEIDDIMDENLERKSTTFEKVAKFIKDELESNNVKNKAGLKKILRAIQNQKTFTLPTKEQNMLQNLMRQAKNIKETGEKIAGINMDNYKKSNMKNNRLTELIKTALKGPLNEATDLLDRNGYQFTRFSMGKKGPGLQISDKITSKPGGNFIQIPGDRLSDFSKALTDVIRVFDDMERQLPVDEAEFTDKYNDHPGLTGKQKNLPDALQKGILGLEEDNIDEYASLARYDKDGNKTVTTIDDIDILPRHKRLQHEMAFNDFITTLKALGYDIPEGTLPMEENIFASKNESLSERIFKELRK